MKNGHPSREWSSGTKQAHEVKRDHQGEMRRGVEHLKEHHAEERREVERKTEEKR